MKQRKGKEIQYIENDNKTTTTFDCVIKSNRSNSKIFSRCSRTIDSISVYISVCRLNASRDSCDQREARFKGKVGEICALSGRLDEHAPLEQRRPRDPLHTIWIFGSSISRVHSVNWRKIRDESPSKGCLIEMTRVYYIYMYIFFRIYSIITNGPRSLWQEILLITIFFQRSGLRRYGDP